MVLDGRVWHSTGANVTDRTRIGLTTNFCAPQFRQQENLQLGTLPEVLENASEELLDLIGFKPVVRLRQYRIPARPRHPRPLRTGRAEVLKSPFPARAATPGVPGVSRRGRRPVPTARGNTPSGAGYAGGRPERLEQQFSVNEALVSWPCPLLLGGPIAVMC